MSRRAWNMDHGPLRGMYRDRENGWIFGVCAGLADFFNFRTGAVRVVVGLSLLLFFWPTVLLYFAAVFLLREKPLIYAGGRAEYEFWRGGACRGTWSHR